uniref:Uncharacterized protein n=1 Tax=Arundo donax TaxID=35708 RepID=A0A0A9F3Z3_ARUDO
MIIATLFNGREELVIQITKY